MTLSLLLDSPSLGTYYWEKWRVFLFLYEGCYFKFWMGYEIFWQKLMKTLWHSFITEVIRSPAVGSLPDTSVILIVSSSCHFTKPLLTMVKLTASASLIFIPKKDECITHDRINNFLKCFARFMETYFQVYVCTLNHLRDLKLTSIC